MTEQDHDTYTTMEISKLKIFIDQLLKMLCLTQSHLQRDELLDFLSFLRQFKTKLNKVLVSKIEVPVLFEDEINSFLHHYDVPANYNITLARLIKRRLYELYNAL